MVAPPAAFRTGSTALVRAVARPSLPFPPCPDLDDRSPSGASARVAWLRAVWADKDVAEALQHSSPVLAAQVGALCTAEHPALRDVRRAALSVARYLLRAQHRATPFGLFAGVATAEFGPQARADWGEEHVAVGRAGAEWLAAVVERLESCPDLLERLPVVVNNTVTYRGDRLIVPFQPDVQDDRTRAVEASLALTGPVRAVLAATRLPIRFGTLVDKLQAEFPEAGPEKARQLLAELIRRRVLITGLHAPSTETDALGYLVGQLDAIDAENPCPGRGDGARTTRGPGGPGGVRHARRPGQRRGADARPRPWPASPPCRARPPSGRADRSAGSGRPRDRARRLILTRLSIRPYGTAAWNEYHQRFYERYGIGTMVPLMEAVADSGTGYPDGYPGAPAGARRPRVSARDDALVRLAQAAALDGRDEVILTDEQIEALDVGPDEPRLPPHLEIGVRVHAASLEELQRGRFRLEVVSVSRGVGVSTGRFLSVLAPADREALVSRAGRPPGRGRRHHARAALLPAPAPRERPRHPLPAGSAHCDQPSGTPCPAGHVLTPEDLAVGCDGRRMYLAAPERGHRVEAVGMHALNLAYPHPAAGAVPHRTVPCPVRAGHRVRLGRRRGDAVPAPSAVRPHVLAPARWRLEASELPGRDRPRAGWDAALSDWRARRRLPRRVYLVEDDRRLLPRPRPGRPPRAPAQTPRPRAPGRARRGAGTQRRTAGAAGRAHEVVVPLKATRPSAWPPLPAPSRARALSPAQMQTPASSSVLLAALYGDPRRQDVLLSRHLPGLLEQLGDPPWWFIRFRDPDQHLRVRIALPDPEAFAGTARTVSAWADELRSIGLLADLRYPTSYREMGRWGSGTAWEAAEEVFRADSRAILAQLAQPQRPGLAHAGGGPHRRHRLRFPRQHRGRDAVADRPHPADSPRSRSAPAVHRRRTARRPVRRLGGTAPCPGRGRHRVGDGPTGIRRSPAYRPHLPGPDTQGIAVDDVLTSLLHVHFVRHVAVNFPEEEVCLYLARAAALAWTARTRGGPRDRPPHARLGRTPSPPGSPTPTPCPSAPGRCPWTGSTLLTARPESRCCTSSGPRAASARGTAPTTGSPPPPGNRSPAARTATRSTARPPSPTPWPAPPTTSRLLPARPGHPRRDRSPVDVRTRLDAAHRRIDAGRLPQLAEFDAIRGLTGYGAYLLRRDPGSSTTCAPFSTTAYASPNRSAPTARPCRAGGRRPGPPAARTTDSPAGTPTAAWRTASAACSRCWPSPPGTAAVADGHHDATAHHPDLAGPLAAEDRRRHRPGRTGSPAANCAGGHLAPSAPRRPPGATAPPASPAPSSSPPWPSATPAARSTRRTRSWPPSPTPTQLRPRRTTACATASPASPTSPRVPPTTRTPRPPGNSEPRSRPSWPRSSHRAPTPQLMATALIQRRGRRAPGSSTAPPA